MKEYKKSVVKDHAIEDGEEAKKAAKNVVKNMLGK